MKEEEKMQLDKRADKGKFKIKFPGQFSKRKGSSTNANYSVVSKSAIRDKDRQIKCATPKQTHKYDIMKKQYFY